MISSVYKSINNLKYREQKVRSFFISFYGIGLLGLIVPFSMPLFIRLTPYALILSFLGILLFHQDKNSKRSLYFFIAVFFTGFIIEVIGVNKSYVFGHYFYGSGLGLKLWNTPLLIGINWLLMVYLSASVLSKLRLKMIPAVILGSMIMLGYDVVLEQVAPILNMWYWENDSVPLQNYLAWFIIALFLHFLVRIIRINTENRIAPVILICHLVFFCLLYIFYMVIL